MIRRIFAIIFILYFIGVNFFGALEMLDDKRLAEQNGLIQKYNKDTKARSGSKITPKWRTPEKKFYKISYMGGATGVWLGMKSYNHKTAKPGFIYNIPTYMGISYLAFIAGLFFLLRRTSRKAAYLVARNAENEKLIYFKIGNVRSAKYVLDSLPPYLSIMNEFYLIASKSEKPWEKHNPQIGI